MRICFTSDLHGDQTLYEQLTVLLEAERPDLLILGGDLLRDVQRDEPVRPQVEGLVGELAERIVGWQRMVPALSVAVLLGNHELACTLEALRSHEQAGRLVLLGHERAWRCQDHDFLGYAPTPPSPHWAKDLERLDLPDDVIPEFPGQVWNADRGALEDADLEAHFGGQPAISEDLAAAPRLAQPWILVAHAPPSDTRLDRLPEVPYPIGSRAVRAFIEERQPVVALHGHVHDSPEVTGHYVDRIGETICINPGQNHERLHAVLLDTDDVEASLRHTVFS
jgi:Icc-related predicted phosphoesterase